MNPVLLLLVSVAVFAIGAAASLVYMRDNRVARTVSGALGALASLIAAAAGVLALIAPETPALAFWGPPPFGALTLVLDKLSAFLVLVIALVAAAASLYSIEYLKEYAGRCSLGAVGCFTNLFIAAMLLVVTAANALYFLVFWEMMTLLSYFLVIFETDKQESIQAGYLYMLIAHAGSILIMLAFLVLFQQSGSFQFSAFRGLALPGWIKNVVFLLAFIGFGAKAGMMPLHVWLPRAHPAAPGHVSALMSGVMIKTAIYGILRVSVDLLGAAEWWWGMVVLAFGVVSAVLGVFYALTEKDIKRLLAYSSVENIGIILMGVGVALIGFATHSPTLGVLGLVAALYHLLNHAFFKGLLFLGAGSVISQAHTQDLNRMGGLGRRMPWTALAFLTGALAVSAIPPLNGFASEWVLYQSFLAATRASPFAVRVIAPVCAMLLALSGGLAVMVFVKAYSGAFSGPARSRAADNAAESPALMRFCLLALALGCVLLGVGFPWVLPVLTSVAVGFAAGPLGGVASWEIPLAETIQAVYSPALLLILLLGLLLVPVLLIALYGGGRAGRRSGVEPWSCGYGYSPEMSVTASSFDSPVKGTFGPIYRLRRLTDRPFAGVRSFSQAALARIGRAEPVIETYITRPTIRLVETAGTWIQALQMGDIRVYCLYIILTLAILLIFSFGRSGL